MEKMSRYFTMWLSFCTFTMLLTAVQAYECFETENVKLQPLPRKLNRPTDCLMECTRMTYIKKLQSQDQHMIRFTDSTQGDPGEHCWSTNLKCTVGSSFEHAFVVLPADITEQVEVTTSPAATKLSVHTSPTTVAVNCGLLYDVTDYFSSVNTGTSFCIQVGIQQHVDGDKVLRCPPYLVTFWQGGFHQAHQQSGG